MVTINICRMTFVLTMVTFATSLSTASAEMFMVKTGSGVVFTNTRPSDPNSSIIRRYRYNRNLRHYSYDARYFSDAYDTIITGAAMRHNIDPMMVKAIIKVESDFERYSISPVGARGLMQLMPDTARLMKVRNVFDPTENIYGGAGYLRKMLNRFGNMRLALAAYNAGPTTVTSYGGVPPFNETRNYLQKVTAAYSTLAGKPIKQATISTQPKVAARKSKIVYYTYRDRNGRTVVTDRPEGTKTVID